MRLLTIPADANPSFAKLNLSLPAPRRSARSAAPALKVFIEAMNLSALANPEGLDKDEFDDYCDHLIVRDSKTLSVVGTYRVLSPHGARRMGKFYSEQEFDLSRLDNIRGVIAEAGRACIHPDYRSGGVMMLWAGLAAYMRKERCEYLMGCASVSLADGGHNAAALYHAFREKNLAPPDYRVTPLLPFPLEDREAGIEPQIPPLLRLPAQRRLGLRRTGLGS
jgi:putative hemolysin